MEITKVSSQDGKCCLQLLNLLKLGKWELSGPDIAAHAETVAWVKYLANTMAESVKPVKPAADTMKVKSVGQLPAAATTKHSKSKKKK